MDEKDKFTQEQFQDIPNKTWNKKERLLLVGNTNTAVLQEYLKALEQAGSIDVRHLGDKDCVLGELPPIKQLTLGPTIDHLDLCVFGNPKIRGRVQMSPNFIGAVKSVYPGPFLKPFTYFSCVRESLALKKRPKTKRRPIYNPNIKRNLPMADRWVDE